MEHLLVYDEHGNVNWKSSSPFSIGGFAIARTQVHDLIMCWTAIKNKLCGSNDVELKWRHFFDQAEQSPLLKYHNARLQADYALRHLFDVGAMFPISTLIQKERVDTDFYSRVTKKGRKVVNTMLITAGILGQFALYLQEHHSEGGSIISDKLGSQREESRLQNDIARILEEAKGIRSNSNRLLDKINPSVSFCDSKEEPLVEIADFVSGPIWSAAQGDDYFFLNHLSHFLRGREKSYGIFIITE